MVGSANAVLMQQGHSAEVMFLFREASLGLSGMNSRFGGSGLFRGVPQSKFKDISVKTNISLEESVPRTCSSRYDVSKLPSIGIFSVSTA